MYAPSFHALIALPCDSQAQFPSILTMSFFDDVPWTIAIPRTLRAWDSSSEDELCDILQDELASQAGDLAEPGLQNGGWTEDEHVELESCEVTRQAIVADVSVYFREGIPSACKDMPNFEDRSIRLRLTASRADSEAVLTLSDGGWDVADYNSASDGY